MLDSHEAEDLDMGPIASLLLEQAGYRPGGFVMQVTGIGDPVVLRNEIRHVDGDDMTYPPVYDIRTSTQRIDELAALVMGLTLKVNSLERQLEKMQGD